MWPGIYFTQRFIFYSPMSGSKKGQWTCYTLLLFPPLAPVADLDSAHTDDDGHNEEEDASNQTSCDSPPLHILRHGISEENLKIRTIIKSKNVLFKKSNGTILGWENGHRATYQVLSSKGSFFSWQTAFISLFLPERITLSVGSGGVGVNPEHIRLGCAHVLDWK